MFYIVSETARQNHGRSPLKRESDSLDIRLKYKLEVLKPLILLSNIILEPTYEYKLVTEDKIHPDRRVELTDLFEIKQN